MTHEEAINSLKTLKPIVEWGEPMEFPLAIDMGIKALEKQDALKHELQSMKRKAYQFLNSDYATGYISAISTIEGFLAEED